MAGITAAQALAQIQALTNQQITVLAIKNIIAQVDASIPPGTTASFYSGDVGGVPAFQVVGNLGPDIKSITDTQIGTLIFNNEDFNTEVLRAINNDPTLPPGTTLEEVLNGKDTNGVRIPGITNSIDDIASAKYAADAAGAVKIIALDPHVDSVFLQSEIEALRSNPNVTSINGIEIADLNSNSAYALKQFTWQVGQNWPQ